MKNNIAYKIYREKTINKIDQKIKLSGVKNTIKATSFLNIRLILTIIIFITILLCFKHGYFLAPICSILFYFLFEYFLLDYQIKKRTIRLEKEALFFFEVLALTLESGRSLKHALDLTIANIDSELSLEFKKTLSEVTLGKSLKEALQDMKKRIPSEAINNNILNMIESHNFGNSITDSMYNEINFLRDKRLLDVKAEIGKLPTKVSVISVIFFVPIMMLIILAPVIINYLTK